MIARFRQGTKTFDLTTGEYSPGLDLIMQATQWAHNISVGTSANIYNGGGLANSKAENKDFEFSVRIMAIGRSAVDAAIKRLSNFLANFPAGDMWFEFSDLDVPETLWGQNLLRLKVLTANVGMGEEFGSYLAGRRANKAVVFLTVAPMPIGKTQRLASATGGVMVDVLGAADGVALGLRIMDPTANKIHNPVFSHATTWDTDWNAGATLIVTQNMDPRFIYPGCSCSAYVICKTGANRTYTETINVGNTNKHSLSAYVIRPDRGEVTSADLTIYYNTSQTTSFEHLGNGIYCAYADNLDGINSAQAMGILMANGRSVYLLGYQCEEKAFHTPLAHGDQLGCSWASTVGNSVTTRTEGRVRLTVAPDTFDSGSWSIRMIWQTAFASGFSQTRYLFSLGASNIRCYFDPTDDSINVTDDTNTATTGTTTFYVGDVLDIVATGGPLGLTISYYNATHEQAFADVKDYANPGGQTYLYIGSTDAAAGQARGIIKAFETYSYQLTPTQVVNLQALYAPALKAGARGGNVPCLWTKDGDDILDNGYDATHDNRGIALDIPGNFPALTRIQGTCNVDLATNGGVYLSLFDVAPGVARSGNDLFYDFSGAADATCNGGEYNPNLVSTEEGSMTTTIPSPMSLDFIGKEFAILYRCKDAGSALQIRPAAWVSSGGGQYWAGDWKGVTAADWTLQITRGVYTPPFTGCGVDEIGGAGVYIKVQRTSGTAIVNEDYFAVFPTPIVNVVSDWAETMFVLENGANRLIYPPTMRIVGTPQALGQRIELIPNRDNIIQQLTGSATVNPVLSRTLTLMIKITPRYALI